MCVHVCVWAHMSISLLILLSTQVLASMFVNVKTTDGYVEMLTYNNFYPKNAKTRTI